MKAVKPSKDRALMTHLTVKSSHCVLPRCSIKPLYTLYNLMTGKCIYLLLILQFKKDDIELYSHKRNFNINY